MVCAQQQIRHRSFVRSTVRGVAVVGLSSYLHTAHTPRSIDPSGLSSFCFNETKRTDETRVVAALVVVSHFWIASLAWFWVLKKGGHHIETNDRDDEGRRTGTDIVIVDVDVDVVAR